MPGLPLFPPAVPATPMELSESAATMPAQCVPCEPSPRRSVPVLSPKLYLGWRVRGRVRGER